LVSLHSRKLGGTQILTENGVAALSYRCVAGEIAAIITGDKASALLNGSF